MNKTKLLAASSYLWKEIFYVVDIDKRDIYKILCLADYISLYKTDYFLTGVILEDSSKISDYLEKSISERSYIDDLSEEDIENIDKAVHIYKSSSLYNTLGLDMLGIFNKQDLRDLLVRLDKSEEEIEYILSLKEREEYLDKILEGENNERIN